VPKKIAHVLRFLNLSTTTAALSTFRYNHGKRESLSSDRAPTMTQSHLHVADLIIFEGVAIPSLSRAVEYEAMSYAWGASDFSDLILCNGQPFVVTPHVVNGLKHFRRNDESDICGSTHSASISIDPEPNSAES
jgi:hypothetical protein